MKCDQIGESFMNLNSKLTSGRNHYGCYMVLLRRLLKTEDAVYQRKQKGERFAAACNGFNDLLWSMLYALSTEVHPTRSSPEGRLEGQGITYHVLVTRAH